ncbi:MAG: hypothetical protein ACRCXK_09280 [Wohlfahrtiimonas sp.]
MIRILLCCFVLGIFSVANAQNKPCSKSAGGIKACTKGGEFICNDGRISKSKKRCDASVYMPKQNNTQPIKDKKKD